MRYALQLLFGKETLLTLLALTLVGLTGFVVFAITSDRRLMRRRRRELARLDESLERGVTTGAREQLRAWLRADWAHIEASRAAIEVYRRIATDAERGPLSAMSAQLDAAESASANIKHAGILATGQLISSASDAYRVALAALEAADPGRAAV